MKLSTVFNVGSHIAIGYWVGRGINNPEYRHGAYLAAASFMIYQTLGAWRKGDNGYPEVKEFGIGVGVALAEIRVNRRWGIYRRIRGWFDGFRPTQPKPGQD